MQGEEHERLAGLDLLRGVAALAVLSLHSPWAPEFRPLLPRGYLAVDLFFVLSGLVLADAYRHRLGSTAEIGRYCRARLIRLYPLYGGVTLLCAVAMLAAGLLGSSASSAQITTGKLVASTATALLFMPTPGAWSVAPATFFPLVFVAWSLFWELIVNLLYGLIGARLGPLLLALLLGVGLIGLAVGLRAEGSAADMGVIWDGAWAGGARALFSFFAGVGLCQARSLVRTPRVPALLLAAIFVLAIMPRDLGGWAYELFCVGVLFPVLVWLAAGAVMGPRVRAVSRFGGYLSYPVYLIQVPIALILPALLVRLPLGARFDRTAEAVMFVLVTLCAAAAAARWFDTPVRTRLTARFGAPGPAPSAQSAPTTRLAVNPR